MRAKIFLPLFFIAVVSLTFAFGFIAPRQTSSLSYIESTLTPAKVALFEPLALSLDSPSSIRLGDVAKIRLTVTIDARGNVSVTTTDSVATPIASDVFESYNVIAKTRLDLARLNISPAESMSQPIRAGQSITFTWTVRAVAVGEYEGTAWFFLRFVPKGEDADFPEQAGGPGSELAVAAIPFELRVVSLFGIGGSTARIIGTVGIFLGFLIALPLLLDRLTQPKQ